ncbi:MAG: hypothetical protein EAZ65_08185 [Verrucomicrobia bacterium]|nr:MAG: hypothetical protein EAZ65_08185 [Verrucomicrobiota bacterium]
MPISSDHVSLPARSFPGAGGDEEKVSAKGWGSWLPAFEALFLVSKTRRLFLFPAFGFQRPDFRGFSSA